MDIRQTDPGRLRQRLSQVLAARPLLRGLLRALGAGGFCFVLAGAGLLDGPVPLALAPVCVLPFGPAVICAYLGAAAGYAVFWGLSAALEPVAAGFLLLAGSCLLADLVPDEQGWLASAAAGGIYALLGVIFVLRAGFAADTLLPGIATEKGHIVVDESYAASIPGVFAAGDCTGAPYQIPAAVGEGNRAALSVVRWLRNA